MNIVIQPSRLSGTVHVPASKSVAHRAIICAALSGGISYISGVTFSKDIHATLSCLEAMGANYHIQGDEIAISGIHTPSKTAIADCCESGSTLRFLIPVAAALGITTEFHGQGKLPQRPITPYIREFARKGVTFTPETGMPFTISGKLQSGIYELEGDISSQFITGLLLALPLLEGESEIHLTSPLQSKPYVDITIDCMQRFGVHVTETEYGYHIAGGQTYEAEDVHVEGDFSQAAFFCVANALGNSVQMQNLPEKSMQGDRKIVEIIDNMWYNKRSPAAFHVDASDIPDLVPILAVLGTFGKGVSVITGAERLRIKECDRLAATTAMLNTLGGHVVEYPDGLEIHPVDALHGGTVDACNDHRIAMCAAIAATRATGTVTILGAECIQKSYPAFFDDYRNLGGIANGINLE